MIRDKWIIGVRNKLASLSAECDSCAAIEGSKLTSTEREELKALIQKPIQYIQNKLR